MKHLKTLLSAAILFVICIAQAQNPWAKYGYTPPKALTLSDGKYQEFFTNDTVTQIGSVLFNTITNQVFAFVENNDNQSNETNLKPEIVSRFLSVDPLTKEYPELTPYQFASNRPIDGIDLDGLENLSYLFKEENKGKTQLSVVDYTKTEATHGPLGNGIEIKTILKDGSIRHSFAYVDKKGIIQTKFKTVSFKQQVEDLKKYVSNAKVEIKKLENQNLSLEEDIENTTKTTKSEQSDPHSGLDAAKLIRNIPKQEKIDKNENRINELESGIKTAVKIIDKQEKPPQETEAPTEKK